MPENITLGELYAQFERCALLEGNTKRKCGSSINKLVSYMEGLGKTQVLATDITRVDIAAWQAWMKDMALSVASIRGYFGAVSQVYNWGIAEKLVAENPFATASKIRKEIPPVRIFEPDEVQDLSDAAAELDRRDPSAQLRWVFMLELASTSGLRVGEIWNLRREDIDLDKQSVFVRYRPDREYEYWQWGTKGKRDREVPIFQGALNAATRLMDVASWRYPTIPEKTCKRLQHSIGKLNEKQRKGPYLNFYRELRDVKLYANGVRKGQGKPPISNGGMHRLRHTAITGWFRKGVSLPDAQVNAGHASPLTTWRIYTHVKEQEAVESLRQKCS